MARTVEPGEPAASARATEGATATRELAAPSIPVGPVDSDGRPAEPTEAVVLESAQAIIGPSRRARFESLYLALGQSPMARTWSPAAKAARALALANRGDDTAASARERAALAWGVLPVLDGHPDAAFGGEPPRAGVPRTQVPRTSRLAAVDLAIPPVAPEPRVESRPGLSALSARAGEALDSYIAPAAASTSSAADAREREAGAVLRAPTAAPELVRTGRGRHGGGEVDIPPWFEAAARKMLEERSGAPSDGITLAELTLVTTTSSNQIAASTRSAPSAVAAVPAAGAEHGTSDQIDVEKVANEVYKQILTMMDTARARNGEPYL
jgi:hypothetical protein